jgi:hypothetical protein
VYGLVWWFLGPLTLFPLLLGQPLQWSLDAALRVYPSLVGHLAYGAGLGLVYPFLVRHYDPHTRTKRGGHATHEEHQTSAPALWVLMLVLGLLLPLILMSSAAT